LTKLILAVSILVDNWWLSDAKNVSKMAGPLQAIAGVLKRATVIKEIDQWFVALSVETEVKTIENNLGGNIGVDVGILNLVALSSSEMISNPMFLKHSAGPIKDRGRISPISYLTNLQRKTT
jgi:transposase